MLLFFLIVLLINLIRVRVILKCLVGFHVVRYITGKYTRFSYIIDIIDIIDNAVADD